VRTSSTFFFYTNIVQFNERNANTETTVFLTVDKRPTGKTDNHRQKRNTLKQSKRTIIEPLIQHVDPPLSRNTNS